MSKDPTKMAAEIPEIIKHQAKSLNYERGKFLGKVSSLHFSTSLFFWLDNDLEQIFFSKTFTAKLYEILK